MNTKQSRALRLVFSMLLAFIATFAFIRPANASGCKPDGRPYFVIKGQPGMSFKFFANGQFVGDLVVGPNGEGELVFGEPGVSYKVDYEVNYPNSPRYDGGTVRCDPPAPAVQPPAAASDCDRAKLAAAEQRVAELETKLDQADTAAGDAEDRLLQAIDDHHAAKLDAAMAGYYARNAAKSAGFAKKRAEAIIQLAKDKPGSPEFFRYMEGARFRAEEALGYGMSAVVEGFGSQQEMMSLESTMTGLIKYEVIDYYRAPNPYTDAEYVKAAEEIIKVVERATQIAQKIADDLRAKEQAVLAKAEQARADYRKARDAQAAIKADLAKARPELAKLRAACAKE
ncbi:MAG: hypothetical protein HY782_24145 [Chloroflexi bacterium]|nr:hypothetical protein [Chloroflexota bacterium]